ncbi:chitin binding domain-containing protein, partial [bacterium LRH843]|nr:chitin binding domain-containing protein [bacterium LRH843]
MDREYCNRYIECIDGVAYNRTCEPPLMFDGKKLACDYPNRVNCGTRKKIFDKGG